jgi:hypothetical protein
MQSSYRCLLVAFLLLLCAPPGAAQVQLHGRVIDDQSEEPISGATVVLQEARGRTLARQVTDQMGQFSFVTRAGGPIRLQAERIGYPVATTPPLDLQGYTLYRVEVRLSAAAVVLAPLEIVTRSRSAASPTMSGFERRRRSGTGWFTTREELQRGEATSVSDILRRAPSISIRRRIVYTARGGGCPAQIYIDGFHINRPIRAVPGRRAPSTTEAFPIDEMVAPVSVEGIEVYQGLSTVPAEFLSPEAACGVVAIWTRRGR